MQTDTELLFNRLKELPLFISDLIITRAGERSIKTRIAYVNDYKAFLAYIIENNYSKATEPKNVTTSELSLLSTLDLDTFLTKYMENHSKSSTSRMKASLSVLFKYLTNVTKDLSINNFEGTQKIMVPKKDYVVYLTTEEQETLIKTITTPTLSSLTPLQLKRHHETALRDLALIYLFLDTGLRLSEVQQIDIKDVDLEYSNVTVTRKGGNPKQVYFSDQANTYITQYLNHRQQSLQLALLSSPTDPLFINIHGERLTTRGIEKIIKKWVQAALPLRTDISVHKLRSSFAMSFYEATNDILALQERMNHKSLNTTNIYAKAYHNISKETRNWHTT